MESWLLIDIVAFILLTVFGVLFAAYFLWFKELVPLRIQTAFKRKKHYLLANIITKAKTLERYLVQPDDAGRFSVKIHNDPNNQREFTVDRTRLVYDPVFDIHAAFYYEDKIDPIPIEPKEKERELAVTVSDLIFKIRQLEASKALEFIPTLEKRVKNIEILVVITLVMSLIAAGIAGYLAYQLLWAPTATAHAATAAATHATAAAAAKTAAEANAVVHV